MSSSKTLDPKPNVLAAKCPSRALMTHATSKWGVLVLLVLSEGTFRFSGLRRRIEGVSERMLAQTLKTLEEDGMISRTAYNVVPPHVEYALTSFGQGAATRVIELARYFEQSVADTMTSPDT